TKAKCSCRDSLEVEAQLHGFRARRDEVRAAERGQEVVQRGLVRQVDDCEPQAPFVAICAEEVVLPNADVEQIARFDARGVAVYVKRGTRNVEQLCARLCGISATDGACALRQRLRKRSRVHDPTGSNAEKPNGCLLSGIKETGRVPEIVQIGVASHQTAVVAPVETYPW